MWGCLGTKKVGHDDMGMLARDPKVVNSIHALATTEVVTDFSAVVRDTLVSTIPPAYPVGEADAMWLVFTASIVFNVTSCQLAIVLITVPMHWYTVMWAELAATAIVTFRRTKVRIATLLASSREGRAFWLVFRTDNAIITFF